MCIGVQLWTLVVTTTKKETSDKTETGQTTEEKIIPSQMEVAPLHCTVDITRKRRLFRNTKEIEKM